MSGPAGEMPFLDHLEELRGRILRSLAALVVCFGFGLWAVERYELVTLLKRPIEPYLSGGKLIVLSPTEPLMIVLKLGFVVGLVLASPVIIWQIWAFIAPALYAREKRALVPALFVGLGLFLTGAVVAYLLIVPKALEVLFSFQSEAIAPFITYDAYFDFVLQIVLSLGISFELPLIIVMLAGLGVVTPRGLHRFRRYAIVGACIAGALLSPGADALSMLMMTVPLILLYEIGVLGATVIERRRRRAAAAAVGLLLAFGLAPGTLDAQVPQQGGGLGGLIPGLGGGQGVNIGEIGPARPLDSATARLLGLPTRPSRTFPEADSALAELLNRPGYRATRYLADSATYFADQRRIMLEGQALAEQRGVTLEADTISYREQTCVLDATGRPRLFDKGQVLVGRGIAYNTCTSRGVIRGAFTSVSAGQTNWFVRGNVAADSNAQRLYAGSSDITSCNLPTPHYHFAARKVKWVSNTNFVARPIVLYIRDVPILWLPFIYQETKPGRRSGLLIPQVGISDIIRPSSSYSRQVSNIGYYWATNDYMDLTFRLDWFSGRYIEFGVTGQYNVLDRFFSGSAQISRQIADDGGGATKLFWAHRQQFNLSTSLNFDINYVSNSFVVRQNALDPLQNTQQINSSARLERRFGWGTVTLGGTRRQNLTDNSSQSQLPTLTVSPKPLDLARNVTWSPGFTLTNDLTSNTPVGTPLLVVRPDGAVDTIPQVGSTRTTRMNLGTPLRFGSFNWTNSLSILDQTSTRRETVTFPAPDPTTPGDDSVTLVQTFPGNFSTELDWQTGINLPILFPRTWKIMPTLGITNTTGGPFAIRNRNTGGRWVMQGKRFNFSLNVAPTLFAFFPGIGSVTRIRHSVAPSITFNYAPAARVPEDYARAIAQSGQTPQFESRQTMQLSVGLRNTFEGKGRPQPGDTLGTTARKFRILSVTTSAIQYDFEQAKEPGRTGWVTDVISNDFQSDLLPGFSFRMSHDLWNGVVGTDTADFDPFLSQLQTNFTITGATLRAIGSIFGLGRGAGGRADSVPYPSPAYQPQPPYMGPTGPSTFFSATQGPLSRQPFAVTVNFTLSRQRPSPAQPEGSSQANVQFSTGFSPTRNWLVQWGAQYNVTERRFESHQVQLQRDLHDWRAAFNFTRNANGNFAVFFSIFLVDLPQLKFDYNQASFE